VHELFKYGIGPLHWLTPSELVVYSPRWLGKVPLRWKNLLLDMYKSNIEEEDQEYQLVDRKHAWFHLGFKYLQVYIGIYRFYLASL